MFIVLNLNIELQPCDVCVCVRLQIHQDLREELAKVKTLEALADVSKQLRLRCQVTALFKNAQTKSRETLKSVNDW